LVVENGALVYKHLPTKQDLINKVGKIQVKVPSGKVFDGNEKSQDRMARAVSIAAITGETTTRWKLADNSIKVVTIEELKEALTLSGQIMSNIWLS